jgi:hypothetical protein
MIPQECGQLARRSLRCAFTWLLSVARLTQSAARRVVRYLPERYHDCLLRLPERGRPARASRQCAFHGSPRSERSFAGSHLLSFGGTHARRPLLCRRGCKPCSLPQRGAARPTYACVQQVPYPNARDMVPVAELLAIELFKLAVALHDELPLREMSNEAVYSLVSSKVDAMLGPLSKVITACAHAHDPAQLSVCLAGQLLRHGSTRRRGAR